MLKHYNAVMKMLKLSNPYVLTIVCLGSWSKRSHKLEELKIKFKMERVTYTNYILAY